MENKRARITVVILENRQMIAAILADLLEGTGYQTIVTPKLEAAQEALPQHIPALLLVDRGMVPAEQKASLQALEETAAALEVPVLSFSCSPLPGVEDVMVLRSPGDFAAVVGRVEAEWRKKQPLLGMSLVEMGALSVQELETALRVQKELSQAGRQYTLGDLLVRLSIVTPEDVEKALLKQEL